MISRNGAARSCGGATRRAPTSIQRPPARSPPSSPGTTDPAPVTLARPNPRSRLPATLRDMNGRPAGQFVVMDIGARSGGEAYLQPLAGQIKLIGFDDSTEEECKPGDVNAIQYEHHATIVAGQDGRQKFHKPAGQFSSGLRKGNMEYFDGLPGRANMVVLEELEVETTKLDRFASTLADDHTDFIKIDV